MAILSPSILGYEPELRAAALSGDITKAPSYAKIEQILAAGAHELHVDIMRQPFIADTMNFPEALIAQIIKRFADKVPLDFHLMVDEPGTLIDTLVSLVPSRGRRTTVTLHAEAYRTFHYPKEVDLYTERNTNKERMIHHRAHESVLTMLQILRHRGFAPGIALEPTSAVQQIDSPVVGLVDRILVMSVPTGKGGQSFDTSAPGRIRYFKSMYPNKEVQADGGINGETLPLVLEAGVDNVVIGSYITSQPDPALKVREVLQALNEN